MRKPNKDTVILTSETNFEEIKTTLEKVSGPTGPPMIVNRGGQGSPSSSVELVSDDILTASPFGCTGHPPPLAKPLPPLAVADVDRVIRVYCGGVSV